MDDLISRQAAIDAVNELRKSPWYNNPQNIYRSEAVDIVERLCIKELPSAQPELIRCKDCKHSEHWYRDRRRCFLWSEDGVSVFDDGFCSYAERRTDG